MANTSLLQVRTSAEDKEKASAILSMGELIPGKVTLVSR